MLPAGSSDFAGRAGLRWRLHTSPAPGFALRWVAGCSRPRAGDSSPFPARPPPHCPRLASRPLPVSSPRSHPCVSENTFPGAAFLSLLTPHSEDPLPFLFGPAAQTAMVSRHERLLGPSRFMRSWPVPFLQRPSLEASRTSITQPLRTTPTGLAQGAASGDCNVSFLQQLGRCDTDARPVQPRMRHLDKDSPDVLGGGSHTESMCPPHTSTSNSPFRIR